MKKTTPEFLILGSGAAEGVPAYFCNCRVCQEAAKRGGREIRGRTSYNFGDVLQIDFGPDMLSAFQRYYPRLNNIRHVLITHAHNDHLSPAELGFRGPGFRRIPEDEPPMVIHASEPAFEIIRRGMSPTMTNLAQRAKMFKNTNIAFHEINAFETFEIKDIGATVRTFPAEHDKQLLSMIFLITMGGRTVFVCNDTGIPTTGTENALKALSGKVHIDLAVLDDTNGLNPGWADCHMGGPEVLTTFANLEKWGLIDNDSIKAVNHFSHNSGATYKELCEFFEPKGIVVGYDGLTL